MNNTSTPQKNKRARTGHVLRNISESVRNHPIVVVFTISAPIITAIAAAIWWEVSVRYIHRDIVEKDYIQRSKYEDMRVAVSQKDAELDVMRKEMLVQKERALAAIENKKALEVLDTLVKNRSNLADRIDNLQREYMEACQAAATAQVESQKQKDSIASGRVYISSVDLQSLAARCAAEKEAVDNAVKASREQLKTMDEQILALASGRAQ